ncbi:unnamed protein product, partial [marine sediment metagenome]
MLLTKGEERDISAAEISTELRRKLHDTPGAESITLIANLVRFGANIDIRLAHEDFNVLSQAKERIKEALAQYDGTGDISDNFTRGKREIKLKLKPEARTLGITETD